MPEFQVGDPVFTLRDLHPSGYQSGARDGNQWGVPGLVLEVSRGHGVCYRVQTWDTWGWYEPGELRAYSASEGSFEKILWDHLRDDDEVVR